MYTYMSSKAGTPSGSPQWYTGYATGAAAAAGAVATAATNCRHPQLPSRTTFSLHPPAAAVAPLPSCSSLANLAFFAVLDCCFCFNARSATAQQQQQQQL